MKKNWQDKYSTIYSSRYYTKDIDIAPPSTHEKHPIIKNDAALFSTKIFVQGIAFTQIKEITVPASPAVALSKSSA